MPEKFKTTPPRQGRVQIQVRPCLTDPELFSQEFGETLAFHLNYPFAFSRVYILLYLPITDILVSLNETIQTGTKLSNQIG